MKNERGMTLVELMIVVAIVAILAGIGSVAYARYVKGAKIERLNQYANELASGQERFRSRNNVYWNGGLLDASTKANYGALLDFNKEVPPDYIITTEAWDGSGGGCTINLAAPCDNTIAGYAVVVERDFINGGNKTTVVMTNLTDGPLLLFEGE